jgi:hemerythrin
MSLIKKIEVTKGVYWIEIDKANLRVLCSSPADIVKHLMKRGMIVWTERNGVKFETGPNAILLSDKPLQNGEISNMAEFPVLQMLYRQGMILPNHPNNTGEKPMLIGQESQVKSQLDYIYRGNYGLVTPKELRSTGISKDTANEIMSMKLKFAFGEIKTPDNLIDSCIIEGNNIKEVKNGVTIQRVDNDIYEFSYEDEKVVVDLNINDSDYESPYPLGYFNVPRDYFSIIHSGQGDGWNILEPSMSSVMVFQGKIYLIDAGPNMENILKSLGIGFSEVEGIFHTHSHDDHFAGITALLKSNKKIKYFSTKLVRISVMKKLSALLDMDEKDFEKYFDVVDLDMNLWNNIDGLEVKPILSPHPVENNIFLFRTIWEDENRVYKDLEDRYKIYGHFADLTSLKVLQNMIKKNDDDLGITQEFYDRMVRYYLSECDIKKIDIGGGMIHGEVEDFIEDKSSKIILAHTSNNEHSAFVKSIGSSASFGTIDILIDNNYDFKVDYTKKYVTDIFPNLKPYQLSMFLNLDYTTFNPGSILIKQNEISSDIYLVITGISESIHQEKKTVTKISAGTLLNSINAISNKPSSETIRALSYVTALKIPVALYIKIIHDNNLYDEVGEKNKFISFLNQTWLFGDEISYATYVKIFEQSTEYVVEHNTNLTFDRNKLYMIKQGLVYKYKDNKKVQELTLGDFFNDKPVILGIDNDYHCIAKKDTVLILIDKSVLQDIPIIRWKLFEHRVNATIQ